MAQQNKIFTAVMTILFNIYYLNSIGQKVTLINDIQLGSIFFNSKSSSLTKKAKLKLDSLITKIDDHPTMQVKAITYNKDFCSECDDRSWKRALAILKYLSRHHIAETRLKFSNRLEGDESDKVDLILTPYIPESPHPNVKKQMN